MADSELNKAPENYYSRHLTQFNLLSYILLMFVLVLSFGLIRTKRNDKRKVRGHDKVTEMMESFGLRNFQKS